MNDGFKEFSFRYCDESNHMYKLGKTPLSNRKEFVAIVANVDDNILLLHLHLSNNNYGSLQHMGDDLPQIEPLLCKGV